MTFHAFFRPPKIAIAHPDPGNKPAFKIPVNTASWVELKYFFNLTTRRATAIEREKKNAPFASVEDLRRVKEIPDEIRNRIVPFMSFEQGQGR